ncbi:MAG: exonuclease SbcCD subunit D C-terminal domain-containing protein, partial [Eubacteriales bacterium]
FDYTALGHIHSPQNIIQNKVRYCGTPLKYSVSEITRGKTLTKVTLGVKGDVSVEELALTALHDMRTIRGSFAELTEKHITDAHSGDYISLTLTDELEIPDAAAELRKIYPNLMRLDYDNTRSRSDNVIAPDKTSELSPQRLCEDFYETQNGAPVSCCQSEYLTRIIHEIWEEM